MYQMIGAATLGMSSVRASSSITIITPDPQRT